MVRCIFHYAYKNKLLFQKKGPLTSSSPLIFSIQVLFLDSNLLTAVLLGKELLEFLDLRLLNLYGLD